MGSASGNGRRSRRAGAAALLLAAVAWSPLARAAGLPFSDAFDDDVFGYLSTVSGVEIDWSEVDVDASPSSGSALITNSRTQIGGGPVDWNLECFAVEAGAAYAVEAWILIPHAQATTGLAQVFVSWFSNATCNRIGLFEYGRSPEVRTPGSWTKVEDRALVAPAGAQSARVGMTLFKNETAPGSTLVAHFDELHFAPEPGAATSGGAALAVCAVLGAGRARRGDRPAAPRD